MHIIKSFVFLLFLTVFSSQKSSVTYVRQCQLTITTILSTVISHLFFVFINHRNWLQLLHISVLSTSDCGNPSCEYQYQHKIPNTAVLFLCILWYTSLFHLIMSSLCLNMAMLQSLVSPPKHGSLHFRTAAMLCDKCQFH